MSKELKVDSELCVRCGQCVAVFPENFDFDPKSGASIPISNENLVEDMSAICPFGAISIEEAAPEVVENDEMEKEAA